MGKSQDGVSTCVETSQQKVEETLNKYSMTFSTYKHFMKTHYPSWEMGACAARGYPSKCDKANCGKAHDFTCCAADGVQVFLQD